MHNRMIGMRRDEGQLREEPVQHGLGGRLVESIESLPERAGWLAPRRRGVRRAGAAGGGDARVTAERGSRRLGGGQPVGESGGQPVGEISLHPPDPRLVRLGVQPEAAW
jgi:hypothetical protein